MAAAALEASFPLLSHSSLFHDYPNLLQPFNIRICNSTLFKPHKFPLCPLTTKTLPFSKNPKSSKLYSTPAQETTLETQPEKTQEGNRKKKLYVVNLPWSFSVADIKNLFGQCGTVSDVEIIKKEDGRSRSFAFVTMASGEEAQAVIDKFDSFEVSGRIIRVEFARRFRKPSPTPALSTPLRETRHKLYVSNLAWKVRGTHLREFFSVTSKPVSSRVVFDSPAGRSTGYGFVSFTTREEAEAALMYLNGKELMGRPVRLKFSEKKDNDSRSEKLEEENLKSQSENQEEENYENQTENIYM